MNVLVVYAHHEPSSYTAALKNASLEYLEGQGHTVALSDLYGQGFQAVAENYDFTATSGEHFNYLHEQKHASLRELAFAPDIVSEIQKLHAAELVVFHFPLWWSGVPAILKGWFDRVLAMGVAYDGAGQIFENGLLRGKRALIVATASATAEDYQLAGRMRATPEQMLHPVLHGTLAYCGMDILQPYLVFDIFKKTSEQRTQILGLYRSHLEAAIQRPLYYSQVTASNQG